jgi:CarboxypepD_reg-like domain/TonB-dependent Receptor Plug Domain
MKLKICLFIAILFVSTVSFSQKGLIEGFIKDADSKTPLFGATVNIQGDKADNADQFGKFNLNGINPGQYEIIVSHIGYKTEVVPVEVKPNLLSSVNIELKKASLELSAITLNSKKISSLNAIAAVDIKLRPINTSQDVLRIVPGLFIAQHAGGGKAEQIFLRGYDIDHGTDIAISVDGMPVNMVSHAHGQGYADLHFLIPETVERTDFDKGPYFSSKGNLATSAYVDFKTKDFIESNSIKAEAGQFNTQRISGLLKLLNKSTEKSRQQFYVASEYSTTDGYFESPQDFHRFNIMGKYTAWLGNQSQLSITASTFSSKWNASGQVPDRAVQAGLINRFGAIDNTEGGNTSRTNINIKISKQWKNNWKTTDQLYFSRYKFSLFSNFTFFLNDPVNGDMINQKEARNIWGYTSTAAKTYFIGDKKATTEFGAGFRYDNVTGLELAKATRTTFYNSIQKGDARELNTFAYINQDIETGKKTNLNAGIRYDYFIFQYKDLLACAADFSKQTKGTVSPKLSFSYSPSAKLKIYINNGTGFHSNDTRVILNQSAKEILPAVYGTDIGYIAKPNKNLILKTAFWHLFSKQEFVYVGDEGVVEPGGRARRMGIDVSARYQFTKWLFGDVDINLTKARLVDEAKGANYIPLAPLFTSIGGLTVKSKSGFSGSLRYRFIGNRPANETKSVTAKGYFINDMLVNYRMKKFDIFISAENLLNVKWREAQFDTESRLKFESQPVSEIHYTPGTPRYIKGGVTFYF